MLYILKKAKNKKRRIRDIICNIISRLRSPYTIKSSEDYVFFILENLKEKSIKKLIKYLKTNKIKDVCITEELRNNSCFTNYLKENKINYFDGSWLFNFTIIMTIDYIALKQNKKLEQQEISILVNNITEMVLDTIKEIALKIKCLNIITQNKKTLFKLEKDLFEEEGIIINLNNNYERSLRKSDFIINYDFSEDEINRYNIYSKACIININKKIKINKKSFNGLYINSIDIMIPQKYDTFEYKNDFNSLILYESFIYKRVILREIRKKIKEDNIVIKNLIGQNGVINLKS